MPVHDPSVQDAANHALKSIQQSSNSLFPYNLQEIVHANAEVSSFYQFNFACLLFAICWFELGYGFSNCGTYLFNVSSI